MTNRLRKILLSAFLLIGLFAIGNSVLAAADVGMGGFGAVTQLSNTDPRTVVANVIRIILGFLGVIAIGLIIYAGAIWMLSGGNEKNIDKAKKILVSSVIGLIIILASFGITTFLLNSILNATGTGSGTGSGPGGVIVPPGGGPGSSCDGITLTPLCEADDSLCGSGLYCNPGTCTCTVGGGIGDPCDSDVALADCQASGAMCMPGLSCNTTTCLCESGSGVGINCDSDVAAGCQASDAICSNLLTCDNGTCTCEERPLIQWISPQGGFCDDFPNQVCLNDSDCSSGTCNVSTPNAASGNIITIMGRYFGTTVGQVNFWDGAGFTIPGVLPSTINSQCSSFWSDDQIMMVVPVGAVSGPVQVVRSDLFSDTTNDAHGTVIDDLRVNAISRPGLCRIDPDNGYLNDPVALHGVNFPTVLSEARFGNYHSFVSGTNSVFYTATLANTLTPNINSGKTTAFVSGSAGELSNYVRFGKNSEDDRGPYIVSFSPTSGAPGQYITIYGSGFGSSRGSSAVYFGDETGYEVDYSFPTICDDSVWSDSQVIVKAPSTAPDGNYTITMVIGARTIDTSALATNQFNLNRSLSLAPSLCKISPPIGDVGVEVSVWGEYFDTLNASSRVRFYNDKDAVGTNIVFWNQDQSFNSGSRPDRADVLVPAGTITGPVKVGKGAGMLFGNALNFQVGSCLEAPDPNNACSPEICCPEGTPEAGRCVATTNDCFADIKSSVYEWDFNTGITTSPSGPSTPFFSCTERSRLLSLCDNVICPNSAGECSPYDNVFSTMENVGKSCVYNCDNVGSCGVGGCTYNSSLDVCVANVGTSCSLPIAATNVSGATVEAFCEQYQGNNRRVIYLSGNEGCPSGWIKASLPSDGGVELVCVDPSSTCNVCSTGFVCTPDNAPVPSGICIAPGDICPSGSACQSDNRCKKLVADECQCCCRKANANQDCCYPLTCAGTCGSDKATDTGTYGSCSGCRIEVGGVVNQAASDAACNCSGSFGKYCDTSIDVNADGVADGVCNDCAQLANNNSCTNHSASCCVDATRSDVCTGRRYGSGGSDVFDLVVSGGTAYCGYYSCSTNNTTCDGTADVGPFASGVNFFKKFSDCSNRCNPPTPFGVSCVNTDNTACAASICSLGASCRNDSGASLFPDCGVCCCDPSNDQCSLIGNPNLRCEADKSPCGGANRGLCCGCNSNSECVASPALPIATGCGLDGCCRARPEIINTAPQDDQSNVCTNIEIQAISSVAMDSGSVTGNIIVVGEYVTPCPEGTVYLSLNQDSQNTNSLLRGVKVAWNSIKSIFNKVMGSDVLASDPPLAFMNYCAVPGVVAVEHVDPEDESQPSILKFRPSKILDTDRKYFVIVKGDENLDNTNGVKSSWGIGMNTPVGAIAGIRTDNSSTFNGTSYAGSFIWSFRTRPNNGGNKGICDIDHVAITPKSYLFNRLEQDLNEDDNNPSGKTFDTVRDIDKKFTARALSSRGEVLSSATGYSWNWSWNVDDVAVVRFINPAPFAVDSGEQLISAFDNITDRKAKVTATVNLIDSTLSSAGNGQSATAEVYVFRCANPWPGFVAGTWRPWRDNPDAMNPYCVGGTCMDMGYELYYCRDSGSEGTADDLPVISSGTTVGSGVSTDVLKESYFFRQAPPVVEGVDFMVEPVPSGGEVRLNWDAVVDPAGEQVVSKYNIYYSQKSGAPYAFSISVPVADAPYISSNSPVSVTGLDKTKDYYFAITAVYDSGEESTYSKEVAVRPADSFPPASPINIIAEAGRKDVVVNSSISASDWSSTVQETISAKVSFSLSPNELLKHLRTFDLRWGTAIDDYPNIVSVPAREALVNGEDLKVVGDFSAGTPYYFIVSATRLDNSYSETSGVVKVVFDSGGATSIEPMVADDVGDFEIAIPSGTIKVSWPPNTDDAVKYNLYWGANHASYGEKIEVGGRDALSGGDGEGSLFFLW